jgi:hypothetical protein
VVSGTVLVSVVIAVADEENGIFDVFAVTVLSVLVLWFTDVYVQTVAAQRRRSDEETVRLATSVRIALHKARGFLIAAVPPLFFLVLGLLGVRVGEFAYWVALWVGVAILGVVGWIAFGGRGIAWYWRVGGAVSTAALGLLAIVLKILLE